MQPQVTIQPASARSTPAFASAPRTAAPDTTARLAASLKRCSFLLNSARLVITDPVAQGIAAEAVAEARAALAAHSSTQVAP